MGDAATAARRLMGESLAAARLARNPRLIANALQNLGAGAWEAGDYEPAEAHPGEAVAICRDMGFRRLLSFCLNALGNVFTARAELRGRPGRSPPRRPSLPTSARRRSRWRWC